MRSANGLTWSDMDPNRMAERAFTRLKAQLVRDEGLGTDIPTTLLTVRGSQIIGTYLLGEPTHAAAIIAAAIVCSDADRAFIGADVYWQPADTPYIEGDLSRRFAAGDPDVREAVTIMCVPETGPAQFITRGYRYDGRTVVWDERTSEAVNAAGGYVRGVQLAFAERARHPTGLRFGTRPHLLGEVAVGNDQVGLLFALSLGCPCGSGRAMEECCLVRN
jgi:hypothetical protein